jgi:hypothetical protein
MLILRENFWIKFLQMFIHFNSLRTIEWISEFVPRDLKDIQVNDLKKSIPVFGQILLD